MSTIVIRGGTVIDGTGAPGVEADVLIRDGRIAEIGPGLSGDREGRLYLTTPLRLGPGTPHRDAGP